MDDRDRTGFLPKSGDQSSGSHLSHNRPHPTQPVSLDHPYVLAESLWPAPAGVDEVAKKGDLTIKITTKAATFATQYSTG